MDRILTLETTRTVSDQMTREQAIEAVGKLLVDSGAVGPEYVTAMHEREKSITTYMGNDLAIPHGTDAAKGHINHSALAVIRSDSDIDWGGKPVRFVVGIAGKGNEHLEILSRIAGIFSDRDSVNKLREAKSEEQLFNELLGDN